MEKCVFGPKKRLRLERFVSVGERRVSLLYQEGKVSKTLRIGRERGLKFCSLPNSAKWSKNTADIHKVDFICFGSSKILESEKKL
jgi:hypothetical protein